MPRKYPPTYEDGSFCITVKFETREDAVNLRDQITSWCSEWITEKNASSRKHVTLDEDGNEVQPFDYFRAFAAPPHVITAEGGQLWLRFKSMPDSYWWKDWMVRMMVDLTRAFPGLKPSNPGTIAFGCDE